MTADTVLHLKNQIADFYMGANSPSGFKSYYNEIEQPISGWRSFLIKGGAGTGKSSLMKRVLEECSYGENLIERIHCSSDPNSLDGIMMYRKKISMVDATPPHVIEPAYPGGYQSVINLCEYFDEEKLNYRLKNTIYWQESNMECHRKCRNYLKCAKLLLDDNLRYVEACTNKEKILKLAQSITKKELPSFKASIKAFMPIEHKRLLSAVTNQGVKVFDETPNVFADKIYLLKDDYGVSSALLLSMLRQNALLNGYDIYSCYCPMDQENRIEHLFVPALRLGFVTENKYHSFKNLVPFSVINAARFTNYTDLQRKKQVMRFNKKAAKQMIDEAILALKEAKTAHDSLELQYVCAVDFSKVGLKANDIIEKINLRGIY